MKYGVSDPRSVCMARLSWRPRDQNSGFPSRPPGKLSGSQAGFQRKCFIRSSSKLIQICKTFWFWWICTSNKSLAMNRGAEFICHSLQLFLLFCERSFWNFCLISIGTKELLWWIRSYVQIISMYDSGQN